MWLQPWSLHPSTFASPPDRDQCVALRFVALHLMHCRGKSPMMIEDGGQSQLQLAGQRRCPRARWEGGGGGNGGGGRRGEALSAAPLRYQGCCRAQIGVWACLLPLCDGGEHRDSHVRDGRELSVVRLVRAEDDLHRGPNVRPGQHESQRHHQACTARVRCAFRCSGICAARQWLQPLGQLCFVARRAPTGLCWLHAPMSATPTGKLLVPCEPSSRSLRSCGPVRASRWSRPSGPTRKRSQAGSSWPSRSRCECGSSLVPSLRS